MKIGLIGDKLFVKNAAGVEKYIQELYTNISRIDKSNEYTVYVTQPPEKEHWNKISNSNPKFKYKVIPKISFIPWNQISLAKEIYTNPQDVVFYPYDTVSGGLVILNRLKLTIFKPICMIHDLGYKTAKEYRNPIKNPIHEITIKYTIRNAYKLVTPSNHVKNVITNLYLNKNENKIIVIPEGLNSNYLNKFDSNGVQDVLEKYKLTNKKYIYTISTIQPRKNYEKLITAFAKILNDNNIYKELVLVIAGKNGWDYKKVLKLPTRLNINKNVKFLGRIEDREAPILMANAKAYISTSLEEGFGLPLLEAMATERPLIISDILPYKELAENNAIYVDPMKIDSIYKGLMKLLNDPTEKKHISKAKELSKKYTWENTAKETIKLFEKL